jgi:hypothetical protein
MAKSMEALGMLETKGLVCLIEGVDRRGRQCCCQDWRSPERASHSAAARRIGCDAAQAEGCFNQHPELERFHFGSAAKYHRTPGESHKSTSKTKGSAQQMF